MLKAQGASEAVTVQVIIDLTLVGVQLSVQEPFYPHLHSHPKMIPFPVITFALVNLLSADFPSGCNIKAK